MASEGLASNPSGGISKEPKMPGSTSDPYVSGPGDGTRLPLLGLLKASGSVTADVVEVIEYHGPMQPPAHVHRERDEIFYILGGTFRFILGQEQHETPAGSLVFIPRGTRHGFTADVGASALLFVTPAGLEGFFQELGSGLESGRTGEEMRAALAGRYDSYPADDA